MPRHQSKRESRSSAQATEGAPKRERGRPPTACLACQKRKSRCDGGERGPCSRCQSLELECVMLHRSGAPPRKRPAPAAADPPADAAAAPAGATSADAPAAAPAFRYPPLPPADVCNVCVAHAVDLIGVLGFVGTGEWLAALHGVRSLGDAAPASMWALVHSVVAVGAIASCDVSLAPVCRASTAAAREILAPIAFEPAAAEAHLALGMLSCYSNRLCALNMHVACAQAGFEAGGGADMSAERREAMLVVQGSVDPDADAAYLAAGSRELRTLKITFTFVGRVLDLRRLRVSADADRALLRRLAAGARAVPRSAGDELGAMLVGTVAAVSALEAGERGEEVEDEARAALRLALARPERLVMRVVRYTVVPLINAWIERGDDAPADLRALLRDVQAAMVSAQNAAYIIASAAVAPAPGEEAPSVDKMPWAGELSALPPAPGAYAPPPSPPPAVPAAPAPAPKEVDVGAAQAALEGLPLVAVGDPSAAHAVAAVGALARGEPSRAATHAARARTQAQLAAAPEAATAQLAVAAYELLAGESVRRVPMRLAAASAVRAVTGGEFTCAQALLRELLGRAEGPALEVPPGTAVAAAVAAARQALRA